MKISLQWLQNYIDLDKSVQELEEALTLIGFEVEGIEIYGLSSLEHCVVGEILKREPHPNADRLSVCSVDVGGDEPLSIVCGAQNYKEGDRVPVAMIGCVLPGNFKIKKSKLRGVHSYGMMCSAKELGLGDDHSGLYILKNRPAVGMPINEVFGESDTIFDVEVTPNRPDCLSHVGIARELAAYFGLDLNYPEVQASPGSPFEQKAPPLLKSVVCKDEVRCPYYTAYSIRNVKVTDSPDWLKERLNAIGLRPINNVVDVTNFVLHELGQPLHAFDAKKISGNKIIVRTALEGEKIVALDEKTYELNPNHLVIADEDKPVAIAGIMGGLESNVDSDTTDIVLEAAYFAPTYIRSSSRCLGLSSDSSYRYERGVDPCGVDFAAMRAIDLILEVTKGELCGAPFVSGEMPMSEQEIEITGDFIRERLGFEVSDASIQAVFESLELSVQSAQTANENTEADVDAYHTVFKVGIPSFRLDLSRPVDLLEEFLRIYGTDKIPSAEVRGTGVIADDDALAVFVREAGRFMVGRNFNECVHYSMRKESEIRQWYHDSVADSLGLANPLASDQSHLRVSVLPGLLDAIHLNQSRGNEARRLFEIGRAFREHKGKLWEVLYIGFVMLDQEKSGWRTRESLDFYSASEQAKSILELAGVSVDESQFFSLENDTPWQAGQAAGVGSFDDGYEAKFGLLSLPMTKAWDIEGMVYGGGIYFLPDFLRKMKKDRNYKPFSMYPLASRDLALLVDENVTAGEVKNALKEIGEKFTKDFSLEDVQVFDLYRGEEIASGKKSLAFNLSFRSSERTLKDKEVNKVFESIQKEISKDGKYLIRS